MRGKKISEFINEPWREVGLNAMKRGQDICERNGIATPEGYMAMCVGLCDIIREIKEEKKEAKCFARQLERQLAGANKRIVELEKENERIHRLERAGDMLCAAAAFLGWHGEIEQWNKVKVRKP